MSHANPDFATPKPGSILNGNGKWGYRFHHTTIEAPAGSYLTSIGFITAPFDVPTNEYFPSLLGLDVALQITTNEPSLTPVPNQVVSGSLTDDNYYNYPTQINDDDISGVSLCTSFVTTSYPN